MIFMRLATGSFLILAFFGAASAQQPTATPPVIREEVVVTANRIETRIADTPASVVTFSRVEIESTAAPTIDDTLRQSAGFSIFRRSSSRNANPTTQGVSLRGVGASGASRSVVLVDGVPLNDPFGGWVQWNRVSPVAVESVEILRGGASSLYGGSSLSGAINVMPRKVIGKSIFSAEVFGGTQGTFSGSGFAGFNIRSWQGDVSAASYQTKGFQPVDEAVRGPVDAFAGVRSSTFSSRFARDLGKQASLFIRPTYFGEVRTNGTGLQTNRTHIRQLSAGGDFRTDSASRTHVNWRAYGGAQIYDQIFSAVNAIRTAEALNRVQRVPAQTIGFSAQISAVYKDHTFLAGVEIRNVRGASDEIAFANNLPTSTTGVGGRENTFGIFFQDFAKLGEKVVIAGSVRYDRWNNYRALSVSRPLSTNTITTTVFPGRTEDAIRPQIAMLYHVSNQFSVYASGSRSFRAPTLNELYRAFRVGNVLTTANENLNAERATNLEVGASLTRKQFSLRTSVFWTHIEGPIANVTLTSTPSLITRRRQNAGSTRSTGIEVEAETKISEIRLSASYLLADSKVTSFPSNLAVVGLLVPQVARHQFSFQARYSPAKWTLAVQGRASSEQFDDDLNLFRLEPYAQIDIFVSRTLNTNLKIYMAIENILNSRYSVGRTPVRTVSLPANLRIGVRWDK